MQTKQKDTKNHIEAFHNRNYLTLNEQWSVDRRNHFHKHCV